MKITIVLEKSVVATLKDKLQASTFFKVGASNQGKTKLEVYDNQHAPYGISVDANIVIETGEAELTNKFLKVASIGTKRVAQVIDTIPKKEKVSMKEQTTNSKGQSPSKPSRDIM